MTLANVVAITYLSIGLQLAQDGGRINGRVHNASQCNAIAADTEVVLHVLQDGEFVPIATTISDERGEFLFDNLPLDDPVLFRIGANKDGVYYPGERFCLGPQQLTAFVNPFVYDSVLGASPLVTLRHEIVLRPEMGVLSVTETMLIANPSSTCYAGESTGDKGSVTLRLWIPSNFAKVTFHKEFYGRRFVLIDGKLVTTIPWPPGERELQFTYLVPFEGPHEVWERPLDLPCSDVRVSVATANTADVNCNLGQPTTDQTNVAFKSQGTPLLAGHVIRVEFGHLPIRFAIYGRWIALGVLICLIAVVALSVAIRQHFANRGISLESFFNRRLSTRHNRRRPTTVVRPARTVRAR